jgi:hypothetical protein
MSTPQGFAIEDRDSSAKSDQDQSDSSDHSSDDGDEDRLIRDMVSPSDDEDIMEATANVVEQEVRKVSREELDARFRSVILPHWLCCNIKHAATN